MPALAGRLRRLATIVAATSVVAVGAAPLATAVPPPFYPPSGNGVTSVQVSPVSDTANLGICNPYTITMIGGTPSASITVELRQTVQAAAPGDTLTIGFCAPYQGNDSSSPVPAQPSPSSTTATSSGDSCTTAAAAASGQTMFEGCEKVFTDQDGDHTIIVGVHSDHVGTSAVHAFTDRNGDGTEQVDEQAFTAHKTWAAADPTSNSNTIKCGPATATNPSGTTHYFDCTVRDTQSRPVPGARVNFQVTSGPDAGTTKRCGSTSDGSTFKAGASGCSYKNSGPSGTDQITAWIDTTDNNLQDSGEPSATLSKTWVPPAPNGSTLSLTCSPDQTTTGGDPTCQEPTSQGTVTITAHVQNGTPPQSVSGVVVLFGQPTDTSPSGKSDSGDSESVSPTQCTTGSDGTCSVQFADSHPSDGETFTVDASLPRQGQADDTATATIVYHDPTKAEARTIAVTPQSTSKAAGGVQPFTATVKDGSGTAVPGVLVSWTESGPGSFRDGTSAAKCTTGASGACSVEVTSLADERGDETVTGTIDPSNYSGATSQCDVTGGKCSARGTVTWTKPSSQPGAKRQQPLLTCFSPKRHLLRCKVVSHPRVIGVAVTFRKVHKDGTNGKVVAQRTTNAHGVAKFRRHHLKRHKVWRVIARVHRSGALRGGSSNIDRTRIR